MLLTVEWLKSRHCDKDVLDFVIRNKLFGFDLDNLDQIRGDFDDNFSYIRNMKNNTYHFNEYGNIVYIWNCSQRQKEWIVYDENQNPIHIKIRGTKSKKIRLDYDEYVVYDNNNNIIERTIIENDEKQNHCYSGIIGKNYDEAVDEIIYENTLLEDLTLYYGYDIAMNRISTTCESSNGLAVSILSDKIESEFYSNDQLKSIGDLTYIPFIY